MKTKEIGQIKAKEDVIELLNKNGIAHSVTRCFGCERICISFDDYKSCCCNTAITVQTCNKDICKIYPHEILYIANENRKSVLHLTNRKVETHYPIEYWKDMLDENIFAQPHYSYIVNLNHVDEITKDFVKIKHAGNEYYVYTSSRKIGAFKKAFLNFEG